MKQQCRIILKYKIIKAINQIIKTILSLKSFKHKIKAEIFLKTTVQFYKIVQTHNKICKVIKQDKHHKIIVIWIIKVHHKIIIIQ